MAEQDSAAEEEGWSSCSAEQRVCAPVSPVQSGTAVAAGDAPGTSVRCQLKEFCVKPPEQVWHLLLKSKAGEGKEPAFP